MFWHIPTYLNYWYVSLIYEVICLRQLQIRKQCMSQLSGRWIFGQYLESRSSIPCVHICARRLSCLPIYVCWFTCAHSCTYSHMRAGTCTYANTRAHMHVSSLTRTHACTNSHAFASFGSHLCVFALVSLGRAGRSTKDTGRRLCRLLNNWAGLYVLPVAICGTEAEHTKPHHHYCIFVLVKNIMHVLLGSLKLSLRYTLIHSQPQHHHFSTVSITCGRKGRKRTNGASVWRLRLYAIFFNCYFWCYAVKYPRSGCRLCTVPFYAYLFMNELSSLPPSSLLCYKVYTSLCAVVESLH